MKLITLSILFLSHVALALSGPGSGPSKATYVKKTNPDCPLNKPYERSENCLCRGIKSALDDGRLICEGDAIVETKKKSEPTTPATPCPSAVSFPDSLNCFCPPDAKKFVIRKIRHTCLKSGEVVKLCAINKDIDLLSNCQCPKDMEVKALDDIVFRCIIPGTQVVAPLPKPIEAKPPVVKKPEVKKSLEKKKKR